MIQCRFFVINGESYLHFLSENWFFSISQIGAPLYEMLHLELLKKNFLQIMLIQRTLNSDIFQIVAK